MIFNVIASVNEIIAWYDLTDILSVMIGCTATFVAIIGGLIANKAISDAAEKELIDNQLQQIDAEIKVNNDNIERLNKWLLESDAEDFIDSNIDELFDKAELADIYDSDDDNRISYEELLPYWINAKKAISMFEQAIIKGTDNPKNAEGIPKSIIVDLDDFQKRICTNYSGRIEQGKSPFSSFNFNTNVNIYATKRYNDAVEEIQECTNKNELLVAKEQLLQERQGAISISKDIKGGMKIFAIVSITNIILPIIFMLFNPTTNKVWYYTETIISLLTFSIGIITMIKYIYSLFPKKKPDKEESEGGNDE